MENGFNLTETTVQIYKLGIDSGNSFTNVVGKDFYDVFDSCVMVNTSGERDHLSSLEFENTCYTVGQGGITAESTSRRDLQKYKVINIFAICRYLTKTKVNMDKPIEIHLCIGLPCGDYVSNKDKYRELFNKKEIECVYSGKNISFKITEVRVVPQGGIIAYTNTDIFKDVSLAHLIDWGSLTVDVQTIRNGQPSNGERSSFESGTIKMMNELGSIFRNLGGGFTKLKDIERVVIEGGFVTEDGFVSIEQPNIQEIIERRVVTIADEIKLSYPEIRNSQKTYMIGGTPIVFKKLFERIFVNCIIEADSEKKNAQAYYNFIGGR